MSGFSLKSSASNRAKITAPNGSVIMGSSNYHSSIPSGTKSKSKRSSVQGSIISQTKSDTFTYHSAKSTSLLSGVSNQIARRKKQKSYSNTSQSIKERTMSATSLDRRKSIDFEISSSLKRYSQSDMSIAIKSEIQSMTKEERDILMNTIDKYKIQRSYEKSRFTALQMKIKEIQSMRPPYPDHGTNICYICQSTFWPILFVKYSCNRCRIFVCKNCLKQYDSNAICIQCFQEMIYISRTDLLFKKQNDDNDSDEDIDIDTIKKMIVQTAKNEEINNNIDLAIKDEIDAMSKTSGSNVSIFKKLLNKRKDESISMTKSRSDVNSVKSANEEVHDNVSLKSMLLINSTGDLNFEEHGMSSETRQGDILIGLSYNFNNEEFRVIIKQCRNLEIAISNQRSSNPYVKVNIIPHIATEKTYRTKTVNSNLNPEFNEQCKYKHIKYDDIIARSLLATVWHHERLGKDVFLGQIILKLHNLPLDATMSWYKLNDKKPSTIHPTLTKYYGDLQFSIKYTSLGKDALSNESSTNDGSDISFSPGGLIVWVKQANNLFTNSYSSLPNAYVKCQILPETSRFPAKKSPIIRKNFNPIWNIPFPFNNVILEDLPESGIEITVWDKKPGLLRDQFLGGISLNISKNGHKVTDTELEVWKKMIDKPETWIEAKLVLRKDLR